MSETIVSARGITKIYTRGSEKVEAVSHADLDIGQGEFVSVFGPSGAGKTTMLNLLGCMDEPTSGELSVFGKKVAGDGRKTNLHELRKGNIGFVFQQFYLIPTLSALENVELPLLWQKTAGPGRAKELLSELGLGGRLHHSPSQLSGGEMQRVAIARALVTSPKLLVADEPTGNLDTKTRDSLIEVFLGLQAGGVTVIVATHDREVAEKTQRTIRLEGGRVVG